MSDDPNDVVDEILSAAARGPVRPLRRDPLREAAERWREVPEELREDVMDAADADAHDAEVCVCPGDRRCREWAGAVRAAIALLRAAGEVAEPE